MSYKEVILGATLAATVSIVGGAWASFTELSKTLSVNSNRLENVESDLNYLKTEVIAQGKDIAAIKAELAEEEIAGLPYSEDNKGG